MPENNMPLTLSRNVGTSNRSSASSSLDSGGLEAECGSAECPSGTAVLLLEEFAEPDFFPAKSFFGIFNFFSDFFTLRFRASEIAAY